MSFGTRLRDKRKELGITQPQLAELLNVSQSAIGNWETDINSPRATLLYDIFDILHCDANYLFQDEMKELAYKDKATPEEFDNIIKKYRSLDPYGQETVATTLDREVSRVKRYGILTDKTPIAIPTRLISYYYRNASAGTGQLIIDNLPEKDVEIPDIPQYQTVSYAIGVNGSSMEPTFSNGDILLVETTQEVNIGEIGIFQIADECYVKKLGESELISLNDKYDNVPLDESARTLGRVIDKL